MESHHINAILLVEDNKSTSSLFVNAFNEFFDNSYDLQLFDDNESMIKYLEMILKDPLRIEPNLILLKVKAKSDNRLETLKKIKSTTPIKNYPLIVHSTSAGQELVDECYDLHANSFIYRDPDDAVFMASLQSMLNFWFTVVLCPTMQKDF